MKKLWSKAWFSKIFGKKPIPTTISLSNADKYFPVARGGKHGVHSKRPYYLKAELMAAAQTKRERRCAKRRTAA